MAALSMVSPEMKGFHMFAFIWPIDGSFSGGLILALFLIMWMIQSACETTVEVAKKVAGNETVQETGKNIAVSFLTSFFKK